ncbi:HAD family hydrolase [Dactylosporangium matsuzakiense]|uniref:Haloacid dehalogenase n=1 Tax=Dactylosporangium matsuzakiense TaxID=53360 RepID=A0A9W6KSA0_9ACTN|nr:HAD family phosphatase [Dactylosporangium matsuzakiense]GLL07231.1 haloacid dehalogenase [Dactylosporangium matsuzakiense]
MTDSGQAVSCVDAPDDVGFDALIFDWDGTLVDSREVCRQGLAQALADVGIILDPDWYWPRQAIALPDLLVLWEQQFGPLPVPINFIVGRCRANVIAAAAQLVVVDINVQIARAARARGQRTAIGSNASTDTITAGLTATGLASLFDTVVTWSDVPPGRGKPALDIFLLAAHRLETPPGRCLVYEDADAGVAAALAAGMTAYNVRTEQLLHP